MKEIFFMNGEIAEIIATKFNLVCNENMQVLVSDEESSAISALVNECYPAAACDVCFSEI